MYIRKILLVCYCSHCYSCCELLTTTLGCFLVQLCTIVILIGASLSEPYTSVTSLHTCVCMFACLLAWTDHLPKTLNECIQIFHEDCKVAGAKTTQVECVCSMHGNFLINRCCESDGRRLVWWRGLLQVSTWYEQQAKPLIHSRDPPVSSRFECEA